MCPRFQTTHKFVTYLDLPKSGISTSQNRGVKCYELPVTGGTQKLIGDILGGLQDVSRNVHQVPSRQKSSNLAVLETGTAKGLELRADVGQFACLRHVLQGYDRHMYWHSRKFRCALTPDKLASHSLCHAEKMGCFPIKGDGHQ